MEKLTLLLGNQLLPKVYTSASNNLFLYYNRLGRVCIHVSALLQLAVAEHELPSHKTRTSGNADEDQVAVQLDLRKLLMLVLQ
jgi:hypothetical protein